MTSDVSLTTTLSQASATNGQSVQLAEDFTQFLTLLTTQLQNQDPLSPMDSTEMTNQIVQFSQVEQQINTNQKLDSLIQMELANMANVGLDYVGMDASYLSSEASWDGESPVRITYAYTGETAPYKGTLQILDEEGNVVFEADAGTNTDRNDFVWNGKTTSGETVPAGTYQVEINTVDREDNAVDVTTVVTGEVEGIETQNGVVHLLIGDRAVPLANIINAREPDTRYQTLANIGLNYIGMEAEYPTANMYFDGTSPVNMSYSYDDSELVADARVKVLDEDGEIVFETDGGTWTQTHEFIWDGTDSDGEVLPAGTYTLDIDAKNTSGQSVDTDISTFGTVQGIQQEGGILHLVVDGQLVPLSYITSARDPTS